MHSLSLRPVLLTGATGYVGGRLLPRLTAAGYRVRCLVRRPEALADRAGRRVEVVQGDLLDPESLTGALAGVETAFYLVHSMAGAEGDLEATEQQAARHFTAAARAAGVRRIIYLGGLGEGTDLSPHLASRQEVGRVLRASGIPTVELRASIIIGSGSLSFELVRALVERLPVMVAPRWVRHLAQPIAIDDVLTYLLEALNPAIPAGVYEIGGPDQVAYQDLLLEYARQRGLRRWFIPVPFLTPRLSGLWLGLVTPLYARIGQQLVTSLRHDTVVTDDRALRAFAVQPRGFREAIHRALRHEDRTFAETRWSDAVSSSGLSTSAESGEVHQGIGPRIIDTRVCRVPAPPELVFQVVERIGGDVGWYYADTLWRIRGLLDLLVGGVGVRRGRRDPERVRAGDTVDWWRVERIDRPARLRLRAEMKVPGRAWLQFEVTPGPDGIGSHLRQTAEFDPRGLPGRLYWYLLYPLHALIFRGMLDRIRRQALQDARHLHLSQPIAS